MYLVDDLWYKGYVVHTHDFSNLVAEFEFYHFSLLNSCKINSSSTVSLLYLGESFFTILCN